MPEFRLTQISDTHLGRRMTPLLDNFARVSEYIDMKRPDLVVNSGDISFDGPGQFDDLEFARMLHGAFPVACRYLPGNHDIGDNPTAVGPAPKQPVTEQSLKAYLSVFGEDRWRFDAAGWCFIGLNSLIMNTELASEAEQFDWLASQLSDSQGKPVALFLHKPIFLKAPNDPELAAPRSVTYRCRRGADWWTCCAPSICGSSPAATSTSAGISPLPTPVTFGRLPPGSSFPMPGRK